MMFRTLLILAIVTGATLTGDFLIKKATSLPQGLLSRPMILGMLLYGTTAIGWFHLMQSQSLTIIGVLFAAANVIGLAALGVFLFDEKFGLRELIGVTLALAAVAVVSVK